MKRHFISILLLLSMPAQAEGIEGNRSASPYPHNGAKYHWSYKCGTSRTVGLTHGCRVAINGSIYGEVERLSITSVQSDNSQEFYFAVQSHDDLTNGIVKTEGVFQAYPSFSITGAYTVIDQGPGDFKAP